MREGNDGIEAVTEFGRELPIDRLVVVAFPLVAGEAKCLACQVGGAAVASSPRSSSVTGGAFAISNPQQPISTMSRT